jgi:hypothetical protein
MTLQEEFAEVSELLRKYKQKPSGRQKKILKNKMLRLSWDYARLYVSKAALKKFSPRKTYRDQGEMPTAEKMWDYKY